MPVLGSRYTNGELEYPSTPIRIELVPEQDNAAQPNVSDSSLAVFPVVPDFTQLPSSTFGDTNINLRDIASGQDWFLDRIVGKIHLHCLAGAGGTDPSVEWGAVMVKAGFFVAHSDADDENTPSLVDEEIDPLNIDNAMDPWIWQRSWLLGNPNSAYHVLDGKYFPSNTADFGSVMDGGHVDTKSKRRIQREQRLFMAVSCFGYDLAHTIVTGAQVDQPRIIGLADFRYFGRLASARHNGTM